MPPSIQKFHKKRQSIDQSQSNKAIIAFCDIFLHNALLRPDELDE